MELVSAWRYFAGSNVEIRLSNGASLYTDMERVRSFAPDLPDDSAINSYVQQTAHHWFDRAR